MQLYLIRHPRPAVAQGLCYGRSDLALAEDAGISASALRLLLPKNLPLFSSPLTRCRLLAEALHPVPQFDARLQELNFGDWEMRTWDAIGRPALDAWVAQPLDFAPPGGESVAALRLRVADFLAELARTNLPSAVLVTHAGVMKACAAELLNLDAPAWFSMQFEFGAVSLIEAGRLVWHNKHDA
ncbi:MAG: alpha-ribazole phosphatase family protein [Betaproteobacteria bacterium]|nr:alpha-ribazole phosphatase family protein [Betaproteobacteria bacterium]